MAKNYRDKYQSELKIVLRSGVASLHHINWNHKDDNIKNLVAVPQELHDSLNLTFGKFPKLLKSLLRVKCYWLIKSKTLKEMESHIHNYQKLLEYINLRNVIQKHGISRAIETFGKKFIEEIIVLEKDK